MVEVDRLGERVMPLLALSEPVEVWGPVVEVSLLDGQFAAELGSMSSEAQRDWMALVEEALSAEMVPQRHAQ